MTNRLALIVEDDRTLTQIFSLGLQTAGFETEVIQDGQVAVTRLAEIVPTIVILDLHLPNVSGRDILKQIRADERLAKTAVIIVTADPQRTQDLRDKADLVLLKPVSVSQLRDLADRLCPAGS